MKTRLQHRLTRVDIAALLVFLAVWTYHIITVRYGFSPADESFYLSVADRFLRGDRPLVDEWSRSQLSSLFLCLPFKAFVALTGGTDGIILFSRRLFVAFNAVFYWIMYIKLRAYKWLSLLATLLLSVYVPLTVFACNYYTVTVRLLMLVCLCLFTEKQKPFSLLVSGILFSCAVILQPGFALLYFGYSVLILARVLCKKKDRRFLEDYAFCINTYAWKYLSVGIVLSAAIFLRFLFARSGLRNILSSLPYVLLSDSNFDAIHQTGAWQIFLDKISTTVSVFGAGCVICAIPTVALAIAWACGVFRSRRDGARKILFFAACLFWILSCLPTIRLFYTETDNLFTFTYAAPLFWFGFVCYLLCEQKKKRVFFFWIVGLASSLCVDFLSDTALSFGLPISYIADLVFITDLVRELRTQVPAKDRTNIKQIRSRKHSKTIRVCACLLSGLTCCCFAAWLIATVIWENTSFLEHTHFGTSFFSAEAVYEDGPCRSIHCSKMLVNEYDKRLEDIDVIRNKHPKNLFVCGLAPDAYLYAGLPYATFSPYANRQIHSTYLDRQFQYWKLHPEKLPECIYVPVDNLDNRIGDSDDDAEAFLTWIRESFDSRCAYTMEAGTGGYILYVSRWK